MCEHPTTPCDACKDFQLNATVCSVGKSLCEKWDCVQTNESFAACAKVRDVVCNDFNNCTNEVCNLVDGTCTFTNVVCDDNDACTADSCDPTVGCVFTRYNVTSHCDDLNTCTVDTCHATFGCQH